MTKGRIKAIVSNLLEIEFDGKVMQNEICYVSLGDKSLMAEVIKIGNQRAYAQLFEMSTSLKLNDEVGGVILETYRTPGCAAASVVPRTAKENIPNRQKSAE